MLVQVVNLLVTPTQAEILNLATDQRIQLVLRNPTDNVITETTGAATANLFEGGAIKLARPTVTSDVDAAPKPRRKPEVPVVVAPPCAASAAPAAAKDHSSGSLVRRITKSDYDQSGPRAVQRRQHNERSHHRYRAAGGLWWHAPALCGRR